MAATAVSGPSSRREVELDDVQGIVRFGYKHQKESAFLLLRIRDRVAARQWLTAAPIASAVAVDPPPVTALQVAFSSRGLLALGVPDDVCNAFSAEFIADMSGDTNRSKRLGDVGASAPAAWQWGAGPRVPDVLVLLYAAEGRLAAFQQDVQAQLAAGFDRLATLSSADFGGVEPFGFADGISQPEIDWDRDRAARDAEQLDYGNRVCLGEFLLGYPNEYGLYTDRPLLDRSQDAEALLLPAEDAPDKADLGRNGSYLVMRQLRQDVRGFWQFLDRQADGDAALRERWAEAMVGRKVDGTPLVESPGAVAPATADATRNAFTYASDVRGVRCPLGAHIRRTNPRNADLPDGSHGLLTWISRTLGFEAEALRRDLVASTRFHRLLRRGREYGAKVAPADALSGGSASDESGLHFICLGANIARQFEFVQGAWITSATFDGLHGESDPLLGRRGADAEGVPTDGFSMPQASGPDQRLSGLPEFVTVLGGGYFFLPGIRALRFLARARAERLP